MREKGNKFAKSAGVHQNLSQEEEGSHQRRLGCSGTEVEETGGGVSFKGRVAAVSRCCAGVSRYCSGK